MNRICNPLGTEDAANEAAAAAQEAREKLSEINDTWMKWLIGEERTGIPGHLGKIKEVDQGVREEVFQFVQDDMIPAYSALKNTAMYGTSEGKALKGLVTPSYAYERWEVIADDDFRAALDTVVEHGLGVDRNALDTLYGPGTRVYDERRVGIVREFGEEVAAQYDERWLQWRKWIDEEPGKFVDWASLRATAVAKEGLGSVAGMRAQLAPEELDRLIPGYYNWGPDVPFFGHVPIGRVRPHAVKGAVKQTGDAMVDYGTQSNLDQMMKSVFPFWIFPTRSGLFWANELSTRPQILSNWSKIQDMSARQSHDVGATNTKGHQLPRFGGYSNIKGTTWWVNPTAALSFNQIIPDFQQVDGIVDPEAHVMQRMASYLYSYGPRAGFHLAPWITGPAHMFNWLDENDFPKRSIFGQMDLIPEWTQRSMAKAAQDTFWLSLNPDATWTPEAGWKDFLIERQLLANLAQEIELLPTEFEKKERVKEAEVNIAQRTGDRWEVARSDLEQSEYFARVIGYLTGMYGKQYNKGEVEIYKARDEASRLRRQIARDADYEAFYNDYRYNTADGLLYGLYSGISHVTDEEGRQLFGDARWKEVAKEIAIGQQKSAKWAATGVHRRMRDMSLREQPIGAPWKNVKEPIWEAYNQAEKELLIMYPDAVYEWGPWNKNDETVIEHVIDKWMGILSEGFPDWDREQETWDDFQSRIIEWENDLPNIGKTAIDRMFVELAAEGLYEPMEDIYNNPILDENGKTVNRLEQLMGPDNKIEEALLAISNSAAWHAWDIDNDDLDDALNRVWRDNYHSAFYDFIGESEGSVRQQLEREFKSEFPGGPTAVQLTGWVREIYGNKWSDENILLHIHGTGVATIEERREVQATERENQANEIYKLYALAGPRGAKGKLYDLLSDDMADALRDFLNPTRKEATSRGLWNHWSEDYWMGFYNSIYAAATELGLAEITDEELASWVEAEKLDKDFRDFREAEYGPNWEELNRLYGSMDNRERLAFRNENPDDYKRLQSGWKAKDVWGEKHPLWQKWYDADKYEGKDTASKLPGGVGAGLSSGFGAGQDPWIHVASTGFLRDDYTGVSLRQIARGAAASTIEPWPNIVVSGVALGEIMSGELSEETIDYLKKLHEKADPYASFESFLARLRELAMARFSVAGADLAVESTTAGEVQTPEVSSATAPLTPGGREDRFTTQR